MSKKVSGRPVGYWDARALATLTWLRRPHPRPTTRCSTRGCTGASVTVLSTRSISPLSSLAVLACRNRWRLIRSQVAALIALIVFCKTDFFGVQCTGRRAKARNVAESVR